MERNVRCPVATTLDLVGDRWTLLVVRDLLKGKHRFSDLRESAEGIPPAILSARLKTLEAQAIVVKRQYQDGPHATPTADGKRSRAGRGVGALATWGEQFAESDMTLIDGECGHASASSTLPDMRSARATEPRAADPLVAPSPRLPPEPDGDTLPFRKFLPRGVPVHVIGVRVGSPAVNQP